MKSVFKNLLMAIAMMTTIIVLNSCEGHSGETDDYGIDQAELDRTRNEINGEMRKADSLVEASLRKEIQLLKEEIAILKEDMKKKK